MSYALRVNYATHTPSGFMNKKEDLQVLPTYLPTQKLKYLSTWFQRVTIIITKPTITKIIQFLGPKNQQRILNV